VYQIDGQNVVVKRCTARRGSKTLKQSFREHVVALLQSLMVVHRVTPHLVMHFGADLNIHNTTLHMSMFMEQFDGSLDTQKILNTDTDWISFQFQAASAVVAMSTLLNIVHNDLYPRNILVRRLRHTKVSVYHIHGTEYTVQIPFLCVISDFGICGSPLLDSLYGSAPEVQQGLRSQVFDGKFSKHAGKGHILAFKQLAPYSRDLYLLFKYALGASSVKDWCTTCLDLIDTHIDQLNETSTLSSLLKLFFEALDEQQVTVKITNSGKAEWVCTMSKQPQILKDAQMFLETMPIT
jgi:serine/threonine protein kinase